MIERNNWYSYSSQVHEFLDYANQGYSYPYLSQYFGNTEHPFTQQVDNNKLDIAMEDGQIEISEDAIECQSEPTSLPQKACDQGGTIEKCHICGQKVVQFLESIFMCQSHYSQWLSFQKSPKILGKKIKELREEKRIWRSELATQIQLSTEAICKWENGRGLPLISNLLKVAEALNQPLSAFFDGVTIVPSFADEKKAAHIVSKTMIDKCCICAQEAIKYIAERPICKRHLSKWDSLDLKKLGKKILDARDEQNICQEALATKTGLNRSTIRSWENGSKQLYFKNLEKLAKALEKPLSYFLDDEAQ